MQRVAYQNLLLAHSDSFRTACGQSGAKVPPPSGGIGNDIGGGSSDAVLLQDGGAEVAEHSFGVLAYSFNHHPIPVFQTRDSNM